MKKNYTQYLIGSLLMALAGYKFLAGNILEFLTYFTARLAFVTMGLIKNKVLEKHSKFLNAVSWILVLAAGFLLLVLFRSDP